MSDNDSKAGLELPLVLKDTSTWPSDSKCPVCSKEFNGAFATVNGGALMMDGDVDGMDERMRAFITLIWHGRHDHDGEADDVYAGLDIVEDGAQGQFDLYFCSTACLRAFFNACVDKLEQKVEADRKHAHLLSIGDPETLRLEEERTNRLNQELEESGVFEKLETHTLK